MLLEGEGPVRPGRWKSGRPKEKTAGRQYSSVPAACRGSGQKSPRSGGSDQASLLDQARDHPVLDLRDRTRFRDLDQVAHVVLALLIVRVVLARAADDLAVQLVLHAALDEHRDGLGALVAHDATDEGARVGLGLRRLLSLRHLAAPFF